MFTDETQEDTTLENGVEEVEETEEETESSTDWEAEAKKWKAIAERNKKKVETKETNKVAKAPDRYDVERTVLEAQGMPEELLTILEKVSKLEGTSLLAATKDPLFIASKEKYEQEQRLKEAQVGASKGSGAGASKVSFDTPGLSKDQHKELWKKAVGR